MDVKQQHNKQQQILVWSEAFDLIKTLWQDALANNYSKVFIYNHNIAHTQINNNHRFGIRRGSGTNWLF